MLGQDIYARAGGFAKIKPIVEIELTLATHPTKSTQIERLAGYADVLEQLYHVKEGDVIIAASNSGRNVPCFWTSTSYWHNHVWVHGTGC